MINVQFFVIEIDFHLLMKTDYEQEHEHDYEALFPEHFHQFYAPIAVAPFVIVPANHFHEPVAKHKRQLAVENAGVWIAHDIL